MRFKAHALAVISSAAMIFLYGACQKTEAPQYEPEERTNFFTFEGYSLDINSVVQYDKGDNSVELWLSPEKGLSTTAEIRNAGDYVVLNTHASYMGGRDRFTAQASKDSYIRFTEDLQFSYGNSGIAYIEISKDTDQITIAFMAQKLYTKESGAGDSNAQIEGSYSGNFIVEKEKAYVNEWGFNREHNSISDAILTMREDDGNWSVAMIDNDGDETLMISLPHDRLNKDIQVGSGNSANGISLYYNGGVEFPLKGASGWIRINTDSEDTPMKISISLLKGEELLRAEYAGEFSTKLIKQNRFIYSWDGDSPYEGNHTIVKLMTQTLGTQIKFYFSPSEGYSVGNANYTHMPILTIPKSIINEGKFFFKDLADWAFEYDLMQVYPYEDEYKPHPDTEDYVSISYSNGEYEIDMILNGLATGMNSGHIDLFFKGETK